MSRRQFLQRSAIAGAGALAVPAAIAQSGPQIRWRMTSSFPKTLDTLFGAGELIAKRVAAATGGRFEIRTFAPGEIVPALQVVDAVQNDTVEMGYTAGYYYVGKDPTFAFDTAMPFGLNTRQTNAWMMQGGGDKLMEEFFRQYNIKAIPAGNTTAQMGGWYRREFNTVKDLQGMKFRIAGFAGQVLARLGVVPQQIPAGDIYSALEKGTIDAAEWVGPHDDEKLGLAKVAKYYYAPAFWEGSAQLSLYINHKQWDSLPPEYKAILEAACAEAVLWTTARYDALNPAALKRLVAGGAQLRRFPRVVMEAAYKEAQALYAETAAKNENFRKVYESWNKFRIEQVQWAQVAELPFDNFMASIKG
jgi:TRAP-type mannitol/chloroaromatic compound transport system substrate-binding protein